VVQACFKRHKIDFERLSEQAEGFNDLVEALSIMQKSQPNYTEDDLKRISVPVLVVHSEYDEFIKEEHSRYLAKAIPGASFQLLQGVSHFAPLQRPDLFNKIVLDFFEGIKY
jgi:pimeloyl-ACP methyl ester carboxylesterase